MSWSMPWSSTFFKSFSISSSFSSGLRLAVSSIWFGAFSDAGSFGKAANPGHRTRRYHRSVSEIRYERSRISDKEEGTVACATSQLTLCEAQKRLLWACRHIRRAEAECIPVDEQVNSKWCVRAYDGVSI